MDSYTKIPDIPVNLYLIIYPYEKRAANHEIL